MFLYNNPIYLNYLRHNPYYYEVIEDGKFNVFLKNAKKDLKLTYHDRLTDFNKKLTFMGSVLKNMKNN